MLYCSVSTSSFHSDVGISNQLDIVRESVWYYVRNHFPSFAGMDCNAVFSEIFNMRTFQCLGDTEKSVSLLSLCNDCSLDFISLWHVFVHYVIQNDFLAIIAITNSMARAAC